MAQATYDDANLLLRLYDLRREDKLRAARAWFVSDFKPKSMAEANVLCPPGSDNHRRMRMVTTYWDMVASFVTAGVLNPELFFASNRECLLVWIRVRPIIAEIRSAFKDPGYLKHLETVGVQFADFLNRTSPEALEAFTARVGG